MCWGHMGTSNENNRLKRLLADAMLDSPTQPMIRGIMGPWAMLKEIGAKKW